jgi:hypothetical protein
MRTLSCAAIFVVCLASGLSETRIPFSTVTIAYRFDGTTSQVMLQQMKSEIGTLLDTSLFRADWRDRAQITDSERFANLIVIDFQGQCRTGPVETAPRNGQTDTHDVAGTREQ